MKWSNCKKCTKEFCKDFQLLNREDDAEFAYAKEGLVFRLPCPNTHRDNYMAFTNGNDFITGRGKQFRTFSDLLNYITTISTLSLETLLKFMKYKSHLTQ